MKVIELFAGVGSQTQALKNIGVEHKVIGISEIDKYAISSYEQLHGSVNNFGDISKIEKLPGADLWTYSFPCQDLSIAGNMEGIKKGNRSGLLKEVERLLLVSEKPKYLLMENVKNLVSKKFKPDFEKWCEVLESLGYKNYCEVLNSKHYGVPQNRERVFMVSILNDENYIFYKKEFLNLKLKDILEKDVEEKFYLSKEYNERYLKSNFKVNTDIKITGTTVGEGKGTNSRHWVHEIDGIVGCISATEFKQPKQIKIMQVGNIVSTGNFKNPQRGRIYSSEGISPALNCVGGGGLEPKIVEENKFVEQKFRLRKLTPRECWRLMGWKDEQFDKIKGISNQQLYKQAGNGIVVNVLESIFENLFKNKGC